MNNKTKDTSSTCGYCQCNLNVKIICNECEDFNLCLQCFACGAEVGSHKKEHDYRIKVLRSQPIFCRENSKNNFSCAEEIMFLDAVEQYGFGNWEDVANYVKTKTVSELQEHYINYYLRGSIGKVTFPLEVNTNVQDHTCPNGGPLSPSLSSLSHTSSADVIPAEERSLGYMPLREDFERESNNDAETGVGSLALNYDDEDIDIAVKLSQIDKYRMRVREREKYKRIVHEYNLVSTFFSQQTTQSTKKPVPKRKLSKDDKDIREKVKVFCQFHSNNEHEQLFENLQKIKNIKVRIKELRRYRRNGITKLEDVDTFEDDKFARDHRKNNVTKTTNSACLQRGENISDSKHVEQKFELVIKEGMIKSEESSEEARELAAMPGYIMLSQHERKLCSSIGMIPANYITIKTCIIKDYVQRRRGIPVKIRYPSGLDKTHRRKIMSFLNDNGWISGVS